MYVLVAIFPSSVNAYYVLAAMCILCLRTFVIMNDLHSKPQTLSSRLVSSERLALFFLYKCSVNGKKDQLEATETKSTNIFYNDFNVSQDTKSSNDSLNNYPWFFLM